MRTTFAVAFAAFIASTPVLVSAAPVATATLRAFAGPAVGTATLTPGREA